MTNLHERYWVKVHAPTQDLPPPRHVVIQNVMPDPQGYYNFPFIHRRPRFPNKPIPGLCRYVEDFEELYGSENVVVILLGKMTEDWRENIMRASIPDDTQE